MKLSDSEKRKHRIISVGITTLSVSLLFLFFALKYIIQQDKNLGTPSPGASFEINPGIPVRFPETKTVNSKSSAKENVQIDEQGNIELKNPARDKATAKETDRATEKETVTSNETPTTGTAVVTENTETKNGSGGRDNSVIVELGKRKVESFPTIPTDMKEEGIVVVEIYVDRNGNVIDASPNGRGTNTSSTLLRSKAKQIAMGIKFNVDNKIEEQKGTVKINFKFE